VRESDTVARFGGDEFAVLLTQIPRAQDAANVARAIKQALDQAFLFEDQEIFVSSSIGISMYPHDGRDTAGLLKTAGVALDRAKEQGGNNFHFYTAGGTTRALKQLVLESNLRGAVSAASFSFITSRRLRFREFHLVGMEALVRWQHPSLGLLYPNEFVPLAEEAA
jgi:predicted signal transduction protein with EAL and GGDEF domain